MQALGRRVSGLLSCARGRDLFRPGRSLTRDPEASWRSGVAGRWRRVWGVPRGQPRALRVSPALAWPPHGLVLGSGESWARRGKKFHSRRGAPGLNGSGTGPLKRKVPRAPLRAGGPTTFPLVAFLESRFIFWFSNWQVIHTRSAWDRWFSLTLWNLFFFGTVKDRTHTGQASAPPLSCVHSVGSCDLFIFFLFLRGGCS